MVSILNDTLQAGVERQFDDWVNRASNPAPVLKGDVGAFTKADADYRRNPLVERISAIKKERDAQINLGSSKEDVDALYETRINGLKATFMEGAKTGRVDPSVAQAQQSALQQLLNGQFLPAIKTFLMSIPFVGDMMAAGGKWALAKFSGTEEEKKMTFAEAREKVTLERALAGGLGSISAPSDNVKYLVDSSYNNIKDAAFKPVDVIVPATPPAPAPAPNPDIALDATFKDNLNAIRTSEDKALAPVQKAINEKQILLNAGVYYVTKDFADELDKTIKLPLDLPAKPIGNSWRVDESGLPVKIEEPRSK